MTGDKGMNHPVKLLPPQKGLILANCLNLKKKKELSSKSDITNKRPTQIPTEGQVTTVICETKIIVR